MIPASLALGSQLDVAPTILDFLGFDYNREFFGRSLLSTSPDRERALISHNRDVSLLKDSLVTVLGIQKREDIWRLDMGEEKLVAAVDLHDSSLIADAIAYYMTAYDMFSAHRLHPFHQSPAAQ